MVNLDAFDNCEPDITWDLNRTPYPFQDESFDLIYANHIMEHLDNFWGAFCELARVLKPNGKLEVYVPAPGTDAIWGFRDHVHEVNECSFYGVFRTYRAGGNAWAVENAESPANRMKYVDRIVYMDQSQKWLTRWPFNKMWLWMYRHLRNVARETGYIFRKVTVEEFEQERERYEKYRHPGQALRLSAL